MKVTKKLLALLLGLTLILGLGISVGATETENTNLFVNPSFENGLEGWTAKRLSHQNEAALSGEYSAEFVAYEPNAGTKFAQYPQNYEAGVLLQKVNNLKGKSMYKFNGYIYSTSTIDTFTYDEYISIKYTFYSDDTILGAAVEEKIKVSVETWTKLQSFITLPNDANGVEIGIIHKGGSTFTRSYDSFSLEEVVLTSTDGNFLLNGSFENGIEGWYAAGADNGSYSKTPNQVEYTEEFKAPAADFGKYYAQYPAGYAKSLLTQRVDGLQSGNIYTFSGYYYTEHPSNSTDPYVSVVYAFYKNGAKVGEDKTVNITPVMKGWTKVEQDVFIPAGVDGIDIGFKTTNGSAYVRCYDKLSLKFKGNLITNGGFEDSSIADKEATGWLSTKGSSTFAFTDDCHSGEVAYTSDDWARIEQAIPAVGETRYKLTYWFKSTDAASAKQSNVRVRFFNSEPTKSNYNPGISMSAINVNTTALLSTDGWQKHVAYFVTPSDTKGISVVLYTYTIKSDKAACMYDDVELVVSDDAVEFLGFTNNAAENTGYETTLNTSGSYKDAGLYTVDAKIPATTLKPVNTLVPGKKIYASAVSLINPDTALVYGLFSMEGDAKRLEAVEIAEPDENGLITTGIEVPETGTYYLEVYLWNSMGGLKPILSPIELK